MSDKVTIKIPRSLYNKLKQCIAGTGFSSVTEFVVFVLRTLVMGGSIKKKGKFKRREVMEIRRRLKRLGYLK